MEERNKMTNQDEKIKAELAEIINKEPLPEEGKKWEWAKKLSEELLPKVKQLAKDCVEIDEGRVSNILNAIFLHGKETPNIAYDDSLPEGQMTIAKGFEEIKTCLRKMDKKKTEKFFNRIDAENYARKNGKRYRITQDGNFFYVSIIKEKKTARDLVEELIEINFCYGHKERTAPWVTNNICNDCGFPVANKKQDYLNQFLHDLRELIDEGRGGTATGGFVTYVSGYNNCHDKTTEALDEAGIK